MSVSGSDLRRLAAPLAVLSLLAAACGPDGVESAADGRLLEGTVELYYADGPEGAEPRFVLATGAGRYDLADPAIDGAPLRPGVRVRALAPAPGSQEAQVLELAADSLEAGTGGTPLAPFAVGEQRTLVVPVNFEDDVREPWSPQEVSDAVFTGLDGYVREASYGQAWLTGDVAGWSTIALSATECSTGDLERLGKAAASARGWDVEAYDRFLFVFPENGCGWSGFARVGGLGTSAFFNGTISQEVLAHEFGHNLGLVHAMAMDCGEASLGDSCTWLGYGDRADVMGLTSRGAHCNGAAKHVLRWLGSEGGPSVETAETSGRYRLAPFVESAGQDPRALRVPAGIDPQSGEPRWYYLEYRQGQGHDASLAPLPGMVGGVLVRDVRPYGAGYSTTLLDMTPASATTSTADWDDPALLPGRTFTDTASGVSLTVLAADASGVDVQVDVAAPTVPECVPASPTVVATPVGAATVGPGSAVAFDLEVTNRDPDACGAVAFGLDGVAADGAWTVAGPTELTLAPGATGMARFTVSVPAGAEPGPYAVELTVAHGGAATLGARATETLTVEAPELTPNQPPVVRDDQATTAYRTPVNLDVLANDTDPDGDLLSLVSVGAAAHGEVTTEADGTVTYAPDHKFDGPDAFTYSVTDGVELRTGTVRVGVEPPVRGQGRGAKK